MQKLVADVLAEITPTSEETKKVLAFAKNVINLIQREGYKAQLQGSIAKETWISGDHDVDVFAFFDKNVLRKNLETKGLALGKKIIKKIGGTPEIAYAEHPYTRTTINSFKLDIVPVYKLANTTQLQSAVDRTPFHTRYVKEKLSTKQKSEVRLLKQFMKGVQVYSAKEKVRGFSGYLCELLIVKYKTFSGVLKAAKTWKPNMWIDLEKHHKKTDLFPDAALVMIDPIDQHRNVAAALDAENFERFKEAADAFLKKPKLTFFFPCEVQPLSKAELGKKLKTRGALFAITINPPIMLEDTLYAQLRKSLHNVLREFERSEFNLIGHDMHVDKDVVYLLELKTAELPATQTRDGPPVIASQAHQDAFTRAHKSAKLWIQDKRWHVEIKRKVQTPKKLFAMIQKDPKQIGIPESLVPAFKHAHMDAISPEKISPALTQPLTVYLVKKKPWD